MNRYIHHDGPTLQLDGMGAHPQWERNWKRSERLGLGTLERCNHCQKPMTEGSGWWVQYDASSDTLVAFDADTVTEDSFSGLRRLGNDCARWWYINLDPATRERFFRREVSA